MESLPEIDVVNSSPSELLASPLNITIQQDVNEDSNSSSQMQEPMETIPVEQIDHINANSQKRKYPDLTADKPFMKSGACPPFIKPSKQNENRDCVLIPILFSRQFTFQFTYSPYDLRTEENDANFLPYQIKKTHHNTYQKFPKYKDTENYLFFNSK